MKKKTRKVKMNIHHWQNKKDQHQDRKCSINTGNVRSVERPQSVKVVNVDIPILINIDAKSVARFSHKSKWRIILHTTYDFEYWFFVSGIFEMGHNERAEFYLRIVVDLMWYNIVSSPEWVFAFLGSWGILAVNYQFKIYNFYFRLYLCSYLSFWRNWHD